MAATIWVIWLGRNERIFRKIKTSVSSMVKLIKLRAFEWGVAANLIPLSSFQLWSQNPSLNASQFTLLKRDELFLHLAKSFDFIGFTDGSFSPTKSGVGGVLLDHTGKMVYLFAGPSSMKSSILSEFEAFLLACRVLSNHWQKSKAVICSDSSSLVTQFLRYKSGLLQSGNLILDFSLYGIDFSNIWATHIDRSLNREADFLAKTGASRTSLVAGKI